MDHFSPLKSHTQNLDHQNTISANNILFPSFPTIIGEDGRESLGILPPDFEKDLVFNNTNDSQIFKNISFLENSDVGRESLGILQLNNLDVNFGNESEKVPEIMLSFIENVNSPASKILDTGFLLTTHSQCLLSATSQNSVLSFNSNSLELPSKIYTLTKNELSTSLLSPNYSLLNNAKIISTSEVETRNRFKSQPSLFSEVQDTVDKFFWSTSRPTRNMKMSSSFSCGKLDFDEKDDLFLDSVFIEGNHIAQKIADGSFLNDEYEIGHLDATPQPEWPNDLDEKNESKNKEEPETKSDSGTIFKTVDKLFPNATQTNVELIMKTSKSSSTSSKSKDAKEILQNLSEIFNATHKSDKQKSQGRLLLSNLADMLNNTQTSKDEILEDSGHSSITENDLNKDRFDSARVTNFVSLESSQKTDCFGTSKTNNSAIEKRLTKSFCPLKKLPQKLEKRNSSTSAIVNSCNKIRNTSNSSTRSNSNAELSIGTQVKPKIGNTGSKKGPLRAVIPLKEMKKVPSTPDQTQKCVNMQSKRTSTPINEPQLKPMAASTPTLNHQGNKELNESSNSNFRKPILNRSNSLNEKNLSSKTSKELIRTPNTSKPRRPSLSTASLREKVDSLSIPAKPQDKNKVARRNSITEGVIDYQKIKRSNSFGKETGIMSSLRKVRENILKSPYYDHKTGILVTSNVKVGMDVEKKVTFKKTTNSSMKMKKIEKENAM